MSAPAPRVAIAHDYLTQRGGGERVVLAMARAFPDARIHTTLYDPDGTFPEFRHLEVVTSPLDRVRPMRRHHRAALPVLAPVVSRMRIDADVVLVSSSGWAHGIRTAGHKIVYCHTPARWLYLTEQYLGGPARRSLVGTLATPFFGSLRRWDRRAADSADRYLANSTVVRDRIHAAYGVTAEILHPPFGLEEAGPLEPVPALADWAGAGYHLVVSRLLPYKNVERVIDAFRSRPDRRLVVVGSGPLREELLRGAPANVRLVEGLTDPQLRWVYATSGALIAASHEDFGLTPPEAMSFGKPVLALRAGGYLDSVREPATGTFFDRVEDLGRALDGFDPARFDPAAIRSHAARFAEPAFAERLREIVEESAGLS